MEASNKRRMVKMTRKKPYSADRRIAPRPICRVRGVTLIELLVVIGVLTLLMGLLLPALGRARDQAKVVKCASSMRTIGHALLIYAGDNGGRLPINMRPWNAVDAVTVSGTTILSNPRPGRAGWDWIGRVHAELGRTSEPWMVDLRCPTVGFTSPLYPNDPDPTHGGQRPGSCWLLNAYCSGRNLSSIPRTSDGVLVQESGIWENMSGDTAMLAYPRSPWRYPHPSVGFKRGARGWKDWLPARRTRPRRNILWVDGHVDVRFAKEWPNGDGVMDPDRIRHMRFGLPGNSPLDP